MPHTGETNHVHGRGLYRCTRCGTPMDHHVHEFPDCPTCEAPTEWVSTVVAKRPNAA